MATFDFKEIAARAALDYIGPHFPVWWKKNGYKLNLPDLMNINGSQLLGNKYFLQLKLSYNSKDYELPNEPLISLGLSKTIVETATVGKYRKGTVKEYICTEDYQITIKGVCVNDEDLKAYPTKQVAIINNLFEINDSLEVKDNVFFELFGIRKIVLKDLQFDDMAGEVGMQKYTITAVSDQDFYADQNEKDKDKINLLG
jgi:hypothetical protein